MKIRPNLQFKGRNFIKLDVKGWRGKKKKKPTQEPLCLLRCTLYSRQDYNGPSVPPLAGAINSLQLPCRYLHQTPRGSCSERGFSTATDPARSPNQKHHAALAEPTSTQRAGVDIPRGNCDTAGGFLLKPTLVLTREVFQGPANLQSSLDLQQTYPQHHKEAGKCHLQVLQVESRGKEQLAPT